MNTYQLLGLPTEVGVLLLTVGLVLALVPYLGGADFGVLKVPDLGPEKAKALKRFGFIIPLTTAVMFLPVWKNRAAPIQGTAGKPSADPVFAKRMPFDTGWIWVGYLNLEQSQFTEGPYETVAFRPTGGERGAIIPAIGDVLVMRDDRPVRIVNFKTEGLKYQMISPPLIHGELQPEDATGVLLPKGSLAIVRDVKISSDPGKAPSVWCRVADCHENLEQCIKARSELSH